MKQFNTYILEKLHLNKDSKGLEFPVHIHMWIATDRATVARDWLHDYCLTERFGISRIKANNDYALFDIEIGDEWSRKPVEDTLNMLAWGFWHNRREDKFETKEAAQNTFKEAFENYDDLKKYIDYFSDQQFRDAYDKIIENYDKIKNAEN